MPDMDPRPSRPDPGRTEADWPSVLIGAVLLVGLAAAAIAWVLAMTGP